MECVKRGVSAGSWIYNTMKIRYVKQGFHGIFLDSGFSNGGLATGNANSSGPGLSRHGYAFLE